MHAAYLAGLMDVKGSIMLCVQAKGKPRAPQLSIQLKHREPLEAIKAEFGGFVRAKRTTDPIQASHAEWRISGNAALATAEAIRPYLTITRRKEMTGLLVDEYPRKGQTKGRRYQIERLYKKMRTLNRHRRNMPPGFAIKRKTPLEKATAEDFAYFIGMLDGQGWIRDPQSLGYGPVLEVTATDPELIAWLRRHFRGSMHKVTPRPGKKASFSWRLGRREAVPLLKIAAPHLLVPERRKKAEAWL